MSKPLRECERLQIAAMIISHKMPKIYVGKKETEESIDDAIDDALMIADRLIARSGAIVLTRSMLRDAISKMDCSTESAIRCELELFGGAE